MRVENFILKFKIKEDNELFKKRSSPSTTLRQIWLTNGEVLEKEKKKRMSL